MDELEALKIALEEQIRQCGRYTVQEVSGSWYHGRINGLGYAIQLIKEIEEKRKMKKEAEASKGHWVLYVGKDWEGVETIPFHQEKEPADICELCQIPENKCRCNCCEFCGAYDWKCGDDCAWCNNHGGLKGEDCDCGQ